MDEQFDLRDLPDAPVASAPWYFRIGRYLARRNIRGGARLLVEARRLGLLDRLAVYSVGNIQLRVPLWRPCNTWDQSDVNGYESDLIEVLTDTCRAMPGDGVTLVDCGADIGTISALLVARCRRIKRVIAYEPNPAAYAVLVQNLNGLPVRATAHHAALSNFRGKGRLVSSIHDRSAHAMFIEPDNAGDIDVLRIDDLDIEPHRPLVIKIDVEGSEATVVEGALRTIREASAVIVVIEAHPRVTLRIGADPVMIMRALRAVRRDFRFEVDSPPKQRLSLDAPVFAQLPPDRVYNIIATSLGHEG